MPLIMPLRYLPPALYDHGLPELIQGKGVGVGLPHAVDEYVRSKGEGAMQFGIVDPRVGNDVGGVQVKVGEGRRLIVRPEAEFRGG